MERACPERAERRFGAPRNAGGTGEVYKARDVRIDWIVAIKVLSSHPDDLKCLLAIRPDLEQDAPIVLVNRWMAALPLH